MYRPAHFAEDRPAVLASLIQRYPLAVLVAVSNRGELIANHLPLHLRQEADVLTLVGHIARVNPVWREVNAGRDVLAVFQGPEHYISPNWYPSKQLHERVVPTWNYAVVHVRGAVTWHHEVGWARAHLSELTEVHEAAFPEPWHMTDAPEDYLAKMMSGVVGMEISVGEMVGKWKVSQNRNDDDRSGVAAGLARLNTTRADEVRTEVTAQSEKSGE